MDKIDVSFITLSYNKFDILKQSIKSIIENTKEVSYEHIILDNNSSEGDIFDVTSGFNNLRVYKNNKNAGWSAGINKAISMSRGEYICIVDNDVLFVDNVALKLLQFCKEHGNNVLAGPRILNGDLSIQNSITDFPNCVNRFFLAILFNKIFYKSKIFNPDYLNYNIAEQKAVQAEVLIGACMFFPRKLIERLNGFDEDLILYCADSDICMRIIKSGGKVIYNSNAHAIHLGEFTAGTSIRFGASRRGLDEVRFYRKHYNRFERKFIYLFFTAGFLIRFILYMIIGIMRMNRKQIHRSIYLLAIAYYFIKGIFSGE